MKVSRLPRLATTIVVALVGWVTIFLLLSNLSSTVQADELVDSHELLYLGSTRYVATTGTDAGDCTNSATPCRTVQYAVDVASEGDAIKIATGVYTGVNMYGGSAQMVYLSKTVVIQGGFIATFAEPPDPEINPTILDAREQGRGFYIVGNISPTIEGLQITGGYSDEGGGVYIINATVTLSNNHIFSNTAENTGGGIDVESGYATLNANTITTNTSQWGGGGLYAIESLVMLCANRIVANKAATLGGGIMAGLPSTVVLESNIVAANTASMNGGVLLGGSVALLEANIITNNTAEYDGGGLGVFYSNATLNGNIITGNTALFGGGLSIYSGNVTLTNTLIADNHVSGWGSGAVIYNASPLFIHTTIARNIGGDGSGVYVSDDGPGYSAVVLSNTILVSHTIGLTVTTGNTATLEATFWGNDTNWGGAGSIYTGTINVWGNPDFVDPDASDYHLGPDSAAIDAGVDAGVTSDIDGDTRPMGSGFDIGADEFPYPLTAPGIPALLSPANGILTTTQAITFTWQAGTANAPDGYNVQLDGEIITTAETFSPTILPIGEHTWTVRAFNAAGYSDWVSPPWVLEVMQHRIYLPLIFK